MVRYLLTAAILGAGWFPVLLLPSLTRGWLLARPLASLVFLVVASVAVAFLFRRFIGSAEGFRGQLVRAVTLPYAGCFLFLTLWALSIWLQTLFFGGLANLHDTLALYGMGLTAALFGCFVIVPYGLACQILMQRAQNRSSIGL